MRKVKHAGDSGPAHARPDAPPPEQSLQPTAGELGSAPAVVLEDPPAAEATREGPGRAKRKGARTREKNGAAHASAGPRSATRKGAHSKGDVVEANRRLRAALKDAVGQVRELTRQARLSRRESQKESRKTTTETKKIHDRLTELDAALRRARQDLRGEGSHALDEARQGLTEARQQSVRAREQMETAQQELATAYYQLQQALSERQAFSRPVAGQPSAAAEAGVGPWVYEPATPGEEAGDEGVVVQASVRYEPPAERLHRHLSSAMTVEDKWASSLKQMADQVVDPVLKSALANQNLVAQGHKKALEERLKALGKDATGGKNILQRLFGRNWGAWPRDPDDYDRAVYHLSCAIGGSRFLVAMYQSLGAFADAIGDTGTSALAAQHARDKQQAADDLQPMIASLGALGAKVVPPPAPVAASPVESAVMPEDNLPDKDREDEDEERQEERKAEERVDVAPTAP